MIIYVTVCFRHSNLEIKTKYTDIQFSPIFLSKKEEYYHHAQVYFAFGQVHIVRWLSYCQVEEKISVEPCWQMCMELVTCYKLLSISANVYGIDHMSYVVQLGKCVWNLSHVMSCCPAWQMCMEFITCHKLLPTWHLCVKLITCHMLLSKFPTVALLHGFQRIVNWKLYVKQTLDTFGI